MRFIRNFSARYQNLILLFIVIIYAPIYAPSQAIAQNRLLYVMADELQREMKELKTQEIPPYFMAYSVGDVHTTSMSASFGALTGSRESDSRILSVTVRVGNHQLDNSHELRDQYDFTSGRSYVLIAREDNEEALRAAIWQETNRRYREAVERFIKVKTNVAVKVAEEDSSADFSHEPDVYIFHEPPLDIASLLGDQTKWEEKVKKYSSLFLTNENIYGGWASFSFTVERKHLITSEGASIAQNLTYAQLFISGFIKSDDGMELPLYKSYYALTPNDLPEDDEILADVRGMITKLAKLRNAPLVDPYTGPAVLSGRAAGVFFHEIFGHRVEGHRMKIETEGQTFKKQIGKEILPEHIDIIFDPTLKKHNGVDLMGYYQYDDEGVKARRINIIESGILKGFLMSRSPIENFPQSNGHGRAQSGYSPVSRQSNLIVKTTQSFTDEKLREKLIELCKQQDKPYGLLFQDIQGGFTLTGRTLPNTFNVIPIEVYRVYTDGRSDELVRGVDLVGTPLVMFSMITDTGGKSEVFNGICGAESGNVPVSAVSPSILVTQVEVQKKSKSQERPPILPRPDFDR